MSRPATSDAKAATACSATGFPARLTSSVLATRPSIPAWLQWTPIGHQVLTASIARRQTSVSQHASESALRDSGVRFLAVDMPEANDLTVGIMALVAEAERQAISRRTKEALAMARARGVGLGNPNGAAALRRAGKGGAALRAVVATNASAHAADLAGVITDIQAQGHRSLRAIAAELDPRGMRTRRGGNWQVSNVRNLLDRLDVVRDRCRR